MFMIVQLIQVGADVNIPNNHGLTPLEVINRYTDPRSGHHLKQLLQGMSFISLSHCVVSYHYPSGAVDHAAQVKQQQQQSMRSETPPTALSRPASSRSYHQVHQQVESPNQPHPPSLPPRNQPHPPTLPPPNQPHPPSNQPHPPPPSGQRPPSLEQAPPDWKPEEPRGVALGGNASLAAMIAAKAASRKPMATSPTKKDQTDHPMISSHQQQSTNRNLFQEQLQPHQVSVITTLFRYLHYSSSF